MEKNWEKGRKGRKIGKKDEKYQKTVISIFRSFVCSHAAHAIGELKKSVSITRKTCLCYRDPVIIAGILMFSKPGLPCMPPVQACSEGTTLTKF